MKEVVKAINIGNNKAINIGLPYDPAIPFLGYLSKDIENTNLKRHVPLCSLQPIKRARYPSIDK